MPYPTNFSLQPVVVHFDDRLVRFLRDFPRKVVDNALRSGLRQGARLLQDAAKHRTAHLSGELEEGIKLRVRRGRRGEKGIDIVSTAPHAHLVEYGSVERRHATGKYVGRMPPMPYMRPAVDEEGVMAVQEVERGIASWVNARYGRI